jgi:hypothetical protein
LRFLSRNNVAIILGFVGLFIAVAVACIFLCVYSGEFLGVFCVDSDMVHHLSPTEYGEIVGRVRLNTTKSLRSTVKTSLRRGRHSRVSGVSGETATARGPSRPSLKACQSCQAGLMSQKNIDDTVYPTWTLSCLLY